MARPLPEKKGGVQEASHVANVVRAMKLDKVYIMRESGPAGKDGLLTTAQRKIEMAALLQTALLERSIKLSDNLFSAFSKEGSSALLATLQTQLLQYRSFHNEDTGKAGVFSGRKIGFSGKCGSDGRLVATMQDDLCIALQICMFASAFVVQRRTTFFPHGMIET